eukprot:IDg1515t1
MASNQKLDSTGLIYVQTVCNTTQVRSAVLCEDKKRERGERRDQEHSDVVRRIVAVDWQRARSVVVGAPTQPRAGAELGVLGQKAAPDEGRAQRY